MDLHRHPGHPAGHLRDVRRRRRQAVRRHARGHPHPHRRLRRHGRRPAARGHAERRGLPGRRRRPDPAAPPRRAPLPRRARRRPRLRHRHLRGRRARAPRLVGRGGRQLRRRCCPSCCAAGWPSTSSPTRPPPTTRCPTCPRASRSRTGRTTPQPSPRSSPIGRGRRWPATSRPWSASRTRAPRSSTTATPSATRPATAASSARSRSPASCPPTSGRCSARARARSGGPRSPATRPTSPPPTGPCSTSSPTTTTCTAGSARRRSASRSRACPPGSAGSARASGTRPGLRFNELVADGRVSAPIVIGRDHLDTGSVASPYRETEAMADGSDAIADWPLLNALTAASSGATWVSIHHGGGVGIGRSIHAGQVSVADGTPLAAEKLARVLTNDPAMGVLRHVDAGYDEARRRRGPDVRIPMAEGEPLEGGIAATSAGALTGRPGRAPAGTGGSPGPGRTPSCGTGSGRGQGARAGRRRRPGGQPRRLAGRSRRGGPGVVTGSHLDSAPDGGAFDGPLGVVSAFAALDVLRADGFRPARRSAWPASATRRRAVRHGVRGLADPHRRAHRRAGAPGSPTPRAFDGRGRHAGGARPAGPDPEALRRIGPFVELHVEQGRALRPWPAIAVGTGDPPARPLAARPRGPGRPRGHHPPGRPRRPDARLRRLVLPSGARPSAWSTAVATCARSTLSRTASTAIPSHVMGLAGRARPTPRVPALVADVRRGQQAARPRSRAPTAPRSTRRSWPALPSRRAAAADRRRHDAGVLAAAGSRPRCCSCATRPGSRTAPPSTPRTPTARPGQRPGRGPARPGSAA